jgi:hypothetical protein
VSQAAQGLADSTLGPSFPSLDELLARFHELARAHMDQVALFSYGQSREGESLWALRLGEGARQVLVYAFPQPDEPLGGLALLHLACCLLDDAALRRWATWTLLPCVDPAGARRNEGWFTVPPDLGTYARRHFRPAEGEQVEWSFPSADPAWPWARTLPETRALQALIDDIRPQVLLPLHNSLLGGAYAFLSAEAAGLAPHLPSVWESRGIPTHLGEPELPFAGVLAPGVFRLPALAEVALALSAQGVADPAGLLGCGAAAYHYARSRGPVRVVVPELPLFTVPGIGDTRPAGLSRREVLAEALAGDRAALDQWLELYAEAAPLLGSANPFRGALEAHRRSALPLLQASARWLESDVTLQRPATVAEEVDSLRVSPYLRLLPWGLLGQALEEEASVAAAGLRERAAARLESGLAAVLPALDASAVPIPVLAQVVEGIVRWTAGPG